MRASRGCSRSGCPGSAVATLTYVYSDSTAVLGPLAVYAEPHSYDLCAQHAERLTAPRGWEFVRLVPDLLDDLSGDDLLAVAEAVRERGRPVATPSDGPAAGGSSCGPSSRRPATGSLPPGSPVPGSPASAGPAAGGRVPGRGAFDGGVPVTSEGAAVEVGRRGHLRVLQDPGGR